MITLLVISYIVSIIVYTIFRAEPGDYYNKLVFIPVINIFVALFEIFVHSQMRESQSLDAKEYREYTHWRYGEENKEGYYDKLIDNLSDKEILEVKDKSIRHWNKFREPSEQANIIGANIKKNRKK